jgi:hypothetical protein
MRQLRKVRNLDASRRSLQYQSAFDATAKNRTTARSRIYVSSPGTPYPGAAVGSIARCR